MTPGMTGAIGKNELTQAPGILYNISSAYVRKLLHITAAGTGNRALATHPRRLMKTVFLADEEACKGTRTA